MDSNRMKLKKSRIMGLFLAVIVIIVLFSGCNTEAEKITGGSIAQIKPEDYPLTQGSNPTKIISQKLFEKFTGQKESETGDRRIQHTGTSEAYIEFIKDDSKYDMIIAQQPDPMIEKKLEGTSFTPIAKDALVFITNKENPIERLTMDEIKGILSGKISNWKEVGGKDEGITLFRRNESGGSQILLEKYVLSGEKMAKVPALNLTNNMVEMSECVAQETKKGCTFGYTTYYFAEFSGKREDIKMISIDGVKASYATIERNEYPLISKIYMGVKKMDDPAGEIYEWVLTSEGRQLIRSTGYIPI